MANESQYFSPIIQAMIASAQSTQNANELKQRGDQFKAQQAIAQQQEQVRQQQADQEAQRIQDEHEYQSGMLSAHHDLTQAQLESNKIQQMAAAAEMARTGGDPNAMRQSMGLPAINGLPSSDAYLNMVRAEAAARSGGASEGSLPSQMALQNNQSQNQFSNESNMAMLQHSNATDMQNRQQQFEAGMTKMQQGWKANESDLDRASREKIAGMDIGSRQAIAMLPYNPPTGSLGTMAVAALNGAPLNPDHPTDRAVMSQMFQNGWHPVPKGDIAALKSAQAMIPYFDKMQEIVNKLPTSGLGATGQVLNQSLQGAIGQKSDMKNDIDELNTGMLNVAKTVEGQTGGRVTNRLLGLSEGGAISLGMTKDQGQKNLNNLKNLFTNKIDDVILGGLPDDAKQIIYKMNGIKPTSEIINPGSAAASQVLKNAPPGIHTLSDGSKWMKDASGNITKQ